MKQAVAVGRRPTRRPPGGAGGSEAARRLPRHASREGDPGVFRQKDGADWYVFTQFETSDARRAFPCFDEPSFKVPWQLTLRVPNDHVAVSNTSVASESAGADGRKTFRFRRTAPLPSYLVAFGVGPFEFAEAGTAGAKKTPIRIVVPRFSRGSACAPR